MSTQTSSFPHLDLDSPVQIAELAWEGAALAPSDNVHIYNAGTIGLRFTP